METYKKNIVTIFLTGTQSLNERQHALFSKISDAVSYAWNNWDDNIIATYYQGEKPEFAPIDFVEEWISNEDFEADGYNVEELEELFD